MAWMGLALGLFSCFEDRQPQLVTHEVTSAMRIGWNSTDFVLADIIEIFKRTDVPERYQLDATYIEYDGYAQLLEAVDAGSVDAALAVGSDALRLVGHDPSWRFVGRLRYRRNGLVVPSDSPIDSPLGLNGIAVAAKPLSAAHRLVVEQLGRSGLEVGTGFEMVETDPTALYAAMESADTFWSDWQALACSDPLLAVMERKMGARLLFQDRETAVVLLDDNYLSNHPRAHIGLMGAIQLAYDFYRDDQARVVRWLAERGHLPAEVDLTVLNKTGAVEPNLNAATNSGMRVGLSGDDMRELQDMADFLLEQEALSEPVKVEGMVRLEATLGLLQMDAEQVRVKVRNVRRR